MQFAFTDETVRLANLNVRVEQHGAEERTAVDLKLEWATSNVRLDTFNPELKGFLYLSGERPQRSVDGVEQIMSALRMTDLKPLKFATEVTGLTLKIEHGLGGKSDLVLGDATADTFEIEASEGGSVEIGFRVKALCSDERVLGKLATLIHRDLPMSLTKDDEPVQLEVVRGRDKGGKFAKAAQASE